jgi:hypothetical protein
MTSPKTVTSTPLLTTAVATKTETDLTIDDDGAVDVCAGEGRADGIEVALQR